MMKKISSKEVIKEVLAEEMSVLVEKYTSVDEVKRLIANLQNKKCLDKKKRAVGKCDNAEIEDCIKAIDKLQDVKSYLEPKKKTAMSLTVEEISKLTYQEVEKAIKSVQSKKTMAGYIEDEEERNRVYTEVIRQEELLKEHRYEVAPLDENVIRKSTINDLIRTVETMDITKQQVLDMLEDLIK